VERSVVDQSLLAADAAAPFGVRTDPERIRRAVGEALDDPCSMIVVDGGDLIRREEAVVRGDPSVALREPLLALDELVGSVRSRLDPARDLLLLVSPTSPATDALPHLGVAIAEGPGFGAGDALTSGSTGASGIVALTDVAPTVLLHQGVARPESMVGRAWFRENGGDDPVESAVELDLEARFAHRWQPIVSGAFGVADLLLVIGAFWFFRRRRRPEDRPTSGRLLEWAALAALSFPFVAFASTPLPADDLGPALYGAALVVLTVLVAGAVTRSGRSVLERTLIVCVATILLLAVDLLAGARLQLTGIWGNDAILGGRFAGLGNIGFAVLGSCSIAAAALLVHLRKDSWGVPAASVVLTLAVLIDGMPFLGRDVGGVLALVPALLLTGVLLFGRKVTFRSVVLAILIAGALLTAFAAIDLARPEDQQTHLARLVDDIKQEGTGAFTDALDRKLDANIGVFGESPASFLIPPIWALFAWLVLRGKGRWQILRARHPELHAALVGGLSLALFGGVVNDSGVVVVAVVMSVLAPVAVVMLLDGERHGEAT
ncbi:MAG: hypothetical protein QOH26_306, partial [Actinomycetota bacterium]|nr:hypothetical protein [Actinomycetota bacterium]